MISHFVKPNNFNSVFIKRILVILLVLFGFMACHETKIHDPIKGIWADKITRVEIHEKSVQITTSGNTVIYPGYWESPTAFRLTRASLFFVGHAWAGLFLINDNALDATQICSEILQPIGF
jgi:hypothetical protein